MAADPLSVSSAYSDGDDGRQIEPSPQLTGAFRTPRLRCVAGRPSFMHTAQLISLDAVVAFFARGGDANGFPGTNELGALDLNMRERTDLVAFLKALNGPGPSADLRKSPE